MTQEKLEENKENESAVTCFSFDDGRSTSIIPIESGEMWYNPSGRYWEPPINKRALAELLDANSYHGSLIEARVNHVMELFDEENSAITYEDAQAIATDVVVFGEAVYQKVRNVAGVPIALTHVPCLGIRHTGRGDFKYVSPTDSTKITHMRGDDYVHIKRYDTKQSLYGRPDYLSGIKAATLSDEATKLRMAYYANGSHLGYILYTNEPSIGKEEEKALREALTKARSNRDRFKPFYLNLPGGNENAIKVIPLSEVGAKDIFPDIKNISSQDVMVAHRYPSNLSGIITGDGKVPADAMKTKFVYMQTETTAITRMMMSVNSALSLGGAIRFRKPELEG